MTSRPSWEGFDQVFCNNTTQDLLLKSVTTMVVVGGRGVKLSDSLYGRPLIQSKEILQCSVNQLKLTNSNSKYLQFLIGVVDK